MFPAGIGRQNSQVPLAFAMDVSERRRAEEIDEIFLGDKIFPSAEKMLKHISSAPVDHCAPSIAGKLADRCNVKNIGTFFEKKGIVSVHPC
jgi:hypothetical protein